MSKKRCGNCKGSREVCRCCGQSAAECRDQPTCNKNHPHEMVTCPECRGNG